MDRIRAVGDDLSENERRILDVIWRQGPIPRSDIAEQTGLTGASVTRLVRTLTDRRLVSDTVAREGLRGQPTRPLHVSAEGAHAIGVYFSHRHLEIGLVNLAGTIVHADARPIDVAEPETIAAVTRDFVTAARAATGIARDRVVGVGFALPGDFTGNAGQVNAHAYFPRLAHRDLRAEFADALPYRVFVENDAASAALGERVLGVGQQIDSFVFVHIGHGVGGGIVLNGSLYRGMSGNAGMIGIQFPNDRPRPSGQDLFAHLTAAGVAVTDFPDLERLSLHECPPLRAWIRRAGGQLREQLGITARLLDPEAVIVGGRLPLPLLQALVAEIDTPAFCNEGVGLPRPRVIASALGPRAGVVGAASVPIVRTLFEP